ETAQALAATITDKTIVLTGAMVPYAFGSSDGLFNLGSALSFVQVLSTGVYIAMNGQHFRWDAVRKNRQTASSRQRRETAGIEAAVGGHDHLHGDVEARGGSRRDQSLAGLSRFRLRPGAGRGRREAHARGTESVRADAGSSGAP